MWCGRADIVEGVVGLVHGGAGGIGTTAISLCGLFGVKIIVTCGSDEECSAALKVGATHAINYAASDFVEAVLKITAGHGVQAVLDMVGGDYVARNLACLAEDRSEEHTSERQSLMRTSYAVFCLKQKN